MGIALKFCAWNVYAYERELVSLGRVVGLDGRGSSVARSWLLFIYPLFANNFNYLRVSDCHFIGADHRRLRRGGNRHGDLGREIVYIHLDRSY